jgi:pyrimidine operon attenuation protein/uracil phosphoribosyltransferase
VTQHEKVVLDRDDLRRTLMRIAHEIVEKNPVERATEGERYRGRGQADGWMESAGRGRRGLGLVGIHTRGAVLASRLHALVGELTGSEIPLGDLDISFYRDDVDARVPSRQPVVHASHLDFDLNGRTIVLIDDVLFTGRTVRAAIEALFDYGRPERVQLAVLIDRGHRELPIRPDYVGKNLPTSRRERVNVAVEELDGSDMVTIGAAGDRTAVGAQSEEEEAS